MSHSVLIDISQLRIGMYIQLDVGWMHHPFPVSSFRVASLEQIEALRALNLAQVRYFSRQERSRSCRRCWRARFGARVCVVADTSVQTLRQTFELQCQSCKLVSVALVRPRAATSRLAKPSPSSPVWRATTARTYRQLRG